MVFHISYFVCVFMNGYFINLYVSDNLFLYVQGNDDEEEYPPLRCELCQEVYQNPGDWYAIYKVLTQKNNLQ